MRIVKKMSFYGERIKIRITKNSGFSKERGFPHWDRASWAVWGGGRWPRRLHRKRDSFALPVLTACQCRGLLSIVSQRSQRHSVVYTMID
jgi:hypothetical protein